MGQEIVYCSKCQKRILGADFDKGLAFEVGNQVSCSSCAADLLKTLPPADREQLLSRMFRATQARGSEAPERPASTRRIPVVPTAPASTPGTAAMAIGVALVAAAIAFAAVALSGSKERTPAPAPQAAPKVVEPTRPPTPAFSPEEARRIEAARAALKKARDFASANPDKLDDQVREWEQARTTAEGTPFADEVKREVAALARRLRERVERELAEPINFGLIGFWKLDEANGTVAADFTTAGSHGTLMGGASWATGRVGGAVALNGAGAYVAVPHREALNAFPLTACAWVKTSGRHGCFVNKYVSGSHSGYQIYLLEGRVRAWYFRDRQNFVWDIAGPQLGLDGGGINDDRWHHVALVVDPTGGRLYVDGIRKAAMGWTGTPGSTSTTRDLAFGRYPGRVDAPDGFLHGNVDEVRIYNRALSEQELRQLAAPK